MTKQEARDLIADTLPHDNKEFLRQIREGEQDDGPYITGAFLVLGHIMTNYTLAQVSERVNDE